MKSRDDLRPLAVVRADGDLHLVRDRLTVDDHHRAAVRVRRVERDRGRWRRSTAFGVAAARDREPRRAVWPQAAARIRERYPDLDRAALRIGRSVRPD